MKNKKCNLIIIINIIIVLCVSISSVSYALAEEYYLGDINQDKKVNIEDELLLLRHIYSFKSGEKQNWILTQDQFIYGDINEDNVIDLTDFILLERYIAATKSTIIKQKHPEWLEISKKVSNESNSQVIEPEKVSLDKVLCNLTVEGKSKQQLTAIIEPKNANTNTKLKWESSNEKVAKVDQTGLITAQSEGKTIISVTTENGKTTSCTVIVWKEEVKPRVSITKPYDGEVITAGTSVDFDITIEGNNLETIDESKIKLTGSLANSSTLQITGSDKKYKASVTVPDEIGTLGICVDEGMVTNISNKCNDKVYISEQYIFKLDNTTASNCISTSVGVHNSFYIKDYDFYLNNEKKVSKGTTNFYTYNGLKEGKTYKVKVYVTIYKDKSSNDTVSGWLEKEVKVVKNEGIEVHFIDVAEGTKTGDCIFIKTAQGKTILVDTGADDTSGGYKNKVEKIDKYLRKDNNSKGGKSLVTSNDGIVKIDYLILSHMDIDHIGGFADLTGVQYQDNFPGYKLNTNNTINGENIIYDFEKIVLGCNVKDTGTKRQRAIYRYANTTNKLISAIAGMTIKIDNVLLNIFNPYLDSDVPNDWLTSEKDGNGNLTTGVRLRAPIVNSKGEKTVTAMTASNNNSIVIKLVCGSRKMLLTGDAEFYTEEILLGIPSKQIANKSSNVKDGLSIESSNGGVNSDSVTYKGYISLVHDLLQREYGGCKTIEELENKYRLSRLTPKTLYAQVLKKAHHSYRNTTSIPFLNSVRPYRIVSTGTTKYPSCIIKCVDVGAEYRIRRYYNSDYSITGEKVKLTSSNWYKYVFGVTADAQNHGKGEFYIFTEDGMAWNYSNAYSK